MVSATPSSSFSDIQNHWTRPFITALAQRGIVSGFPNGTFRPDNSMTRGEFAAILAKAFSLPAKRQYVPFGDVPTSYWAAPFIKKAFEMGFISGFDSRTFRPNDRVTRVQVLMSLASGLGMFVDIKPDLLEELPQIYQDAPTIPNYARVGVAITTRAGIVSSFPNPKLLNPNLAATRGDVAVFIYQALVYQQQAPKINSVYLIVPPKPGSLPPTVNVSHSREFRGVWVATVWNSDWPSKPGLSTDQQKAELLNIINRIQALNANALILQVRPEGDALYDSKIEPWSAWLTGAQGRAPSPFYDPLEFAITECRKRNIEVHAWFNPFRAKASVNQPPNVNPHFSVTNPEWVYRWGNQLWMDPGAKVVQDRAFEVMMDVVRRYDIDGVHLDDYFYPYPRQGETFPDSKTYSAYRANGGSLSLADWRRENVNRMVQRLATGIKAEKSYVKFGISPFGIYRPGQPAGITGLDAYNVLFADAKKWLEEGWVDYLAPQLYWPIEQTAQSYTTLLRWWTQQNPKGRHIYAGNNLGDLEAKQWKQDEIPKQVRISRSFANQNSLGNIFFSAIAFVDNVEAIFDNVKSTVYGKPSLPPRMAWIDNVPPPPPVNLTVKDRQLGWKAANDSDIRAWTLYSQTEPNWTLLRILPGMTRTVTLEPGTYALAAVDRLANESVGEIVKVE